MTWNAGRRSMVLALVVACRAVPSPAQGLDAIAANDNRQTAGELRNGVLTLQLEIRKGLWHPEREDGEAIPVYAFGEPGKPLQVPGPLIRVPHGTTIQISVQNRLAVPATLHGLHGRPGNDSDVITIAPGATQHVRFAAGIPGTYLYWARTPDGERDIGRVVDALLGGAFVVDSPGSTRADRIFVLERWSGPTRTAINGKSWPYTERLTYAVGERVHWRVVNASDLSHPMHLHGSHFNLDSVGDGEHYQTYAESLRPLVFTHSPEINETFEMSWTPHEPGRWLFHCHRLPHMRIPIALDPSEVAVVDNHEHAHADPEYAGMGGMIMGITVTGRGAERPTAWEHARKLELTVAEQNRDPRFFQLLLREPGRAVVEGTETISPALTGPAIILTQNEPVEIAVVNRLREATSIHWHGIELESYYDGVPEWGGIGNKRTPPVDPGQTFVARMAPPRAGTFIYHTHWHDSVQLTGGVHGPLIVLPPGQTYDPLADKPFLFSQAPSDPYGPALLLMNGSPQPASMALTTGTKYRFRFINITPSVGNLRVSLKHAGVPVRWRIIAKDAADLPASLASARPADQQISVGETFDFEYEATAPQELTLEGFQPNDGRRVTQMLVFTDWPK